jgi:hypothetical protein
LHGGNETLNEEISRDISYFKMPNYQKVLDGRPLVFLFGGSASTVRTELQTLRERTKKELGVYPYVTSMNGNKVPGVIDAQSKYTTVAGTPGGSSYVDTLAKPEAKWWQSVADAGEKIIPTVSAGWDNRPRINTCPWGNGSFNHVVDPTIAELENHTAAGLDFVTKNPQAAEANMLLLSAWNEHDEGHWIAPALEKYGGTEKLEAIKRAIDNAASQVV